jgi:DNA repair protein RadC
MKKEDWQQKGAGHRQRLRDKFLAQGIDAFTDSEVLELLLTLGTPRKDCKETARRALAHFGSLPAVLAASQQELRSVPGIGPNNGFAIHFLHHVARRYLKARLRHKEYLHSSREVADYLVHAMRDLPIEIFQVILLDAGHAIISTHTMAEGSLTTSTVYPRELIKLALEHHAAAMIVAHNHPSGALSPSEADLLLTRSLHLACSVVGIQLLDHFIVGQGDKPYSFADNGIMTAVREECAIHI